MTVTLSGPFSPPLFGTTAPQNFQNPASAAGTGKDILSVRFGNEEAKSGEAKTETPSVTDRLSKLVADLLAEASEWMEKVTGIFQHNSPILEAIRNGDLEEYQQKLGDQHPDRIDAGNGRKLTMIAGLNYQNDILADLFGKGADPQVKDNRQQPLLSLLMAVQNYEGLLITLDAMKDKGLDLSKVLNEVDADGYTPLAWAVEQQDFPAAKIFLEHGAKPDIPEAGPTSPIQLADHLESTQMLRLLKKYQ